MEEERVTKQKNPKKVAAGHAGAAARKAKQERVLGELREVKTSLKGSDDVGVVLTTTSCSSEEQTS